MEFLDDIDDDDDDPNDRPTLRYRPGNRFVPDFAALVDRAETVFSLCLSSGATSWTCGEPERDGSSTLSLEVAYRADGDDATASSVWDSSVVLSRFLLAHREMFEGIGRVIELGAGCGLVGLCCCRIAKNVPVLLTDLPASLPRLRRNAARNHAVVEVEALHWGDGLLLSPRGGEKQAVMVVAADCLLPYRDDLMGALAATIAKLVSNAPTSFALVAYEERCDVGAFFRACESHHLNTKVVLSIDRDTLKIVRCSQGALC